MSERPTAEQLRELRAWADDVATTQQSAKPRTYRRALTTLALLDAYEATQRPVEPSAHRAEQVAPPAEMKLWRGKCLNWCDVEVRTSVPPSACNCGAEWFEGDFAPPADDVRARVTHEQAAMLVSALAGTSPTLHSYIAQQAELERRARELLLDIERRSRGCVAEDGEYCVIVSESKVDALAELLGTEES